MRKFWLCLGVALIGGCRCTPAPTAGDAGVTTTTLVVEKPGMAQEVASDPVGALAKRVPSRRGRCAQVRSLKERAEADAIAEAIRKSANIPVEVMRADLGDRGTWWRLCVGDEDSDARIVARAQRWTGAGGELEPFLDEPTAGLPRYFILEREKAEPRQASAEQASALLSHALLPDAQAFFCGGPATEAIALGSTATTT